MTDEVVQKICRLLESGEQAQSSGDFSTFEDEFDAFEARYGSYSGPFSDWVHYVRYFVDCWIDASNHKWQFHEPVMENDWAPIAKQIKQTVADGGSFNPVILRGHVLNNDY